jgi:hypothetical protein
MQRLMLTLLKEALSAWPHRVFLKCRTHRRARSQESFGQGGVRVGDSRMKLLKKAFRTRFLEPLEEVLKMLLAVNLICLMALYIQSNKPPLAVSMLLGVLLLTAPMHLRFLTTRVPSNSRGDSFSRSDTGRVSKRRETQRRKTAR